MKKDGLAVEGEGVLVQERRVSSIIVVPRQTQKRGSWGDLPHRFAVQEKSIKARL